MPTRRTRIRRSPEPPKPVLEAPASIPAAAPPSDPAPTGRPAAGAAGAVGGRRKRDSVRLVWDSKPKRPPSPRDIDFQIAEVVIPNTARDGGSLPYTFRDGVLGNEELDRTRMNRLIWGDNLLAMQALLAQGYESKIDLIYIDPPFDSKADYSHRLTMDGDEFLREPSIIERLAYRDTWEAGLDSYLDMLYPRVQLIKRLLSESGCLYLHIGPGISSYVKVVCDEVFGRDQFLNEIVWQRTGAHNDASRFGVVCDTILFYAKGSEWTWRQQFTAYDPAYVEERYHYIDEASGRRFWPNQMTGPGTGPARVIGGVKRDPPKGRHWAFEQEEIHRLERDGRIYFSKTGYPYIKSYLDEQSGRAVQNLWTDIPMTKSGFERTGFDTQKPVALLERVIQSSSRPGDLVADFFCGSGTTAAVAEKLGRAWIACDLGKVGIQVSRARLVRQDAKPFLLENIGNYQREMIYLTGGRIHEMQRIILKLYGAAVHPAHRDLGTRRASGNGDPTIELVHVGYPDRPTTARKAEELLRLAESLDGSGYKRLVILAWDYEYNFDAEMEARKRAAGQAGSKSRWPRVELSKRMIPPDVYDYLKKAKDEAEIEKLADKIKFHEKPYLKLAPPKLGKPDKEGLCDAEVAIARYVVMDFPVADKEREKLSEAVKDNFAILIDYWAVDWDYDGATFRSTWQALRGNGKRAKVVPTTATHRLQPAKKRTIAVRVVDVFGNDAAAAVELQP